MHVLMLKPVPSPGFYMVPVCGFKGFLFYAFVCNALPSEALESDFRGPWLRPFEQICLQGFLKDSLRGHQH